MALNGLKWGDVMFNLILSLVLSTSFAQYTPRVVQADILEGNTNSPNFIRNAACRLNTNDITASGSGTRTRITVDPIGQLTACRLDAAANAETFTFSTRNLPAGYLNGNCEVSFRYVAGDNFYKAYAVNADGMRSNEVALFGTGSLNPAGEPVTLVLPCGSGSTTTIKPAPTLVIEATNASAGGIDIAFARSGSVTSIGQFSGISEPVSAGAMTIGATTTPPTKGTTTFDSVTWYRIGKYAVIKYVFQKTAGGAAGSGTYIFSLPSNLSMDTSLQPNTGSSVTDNNLRAASRIGSGNLRTDSGPAATLDLTLYAYSSTQFIGFGQLVGSATAALWGSTFFDFGTNIGFEMTVVVPIQGWSASQSAAAASQTDYGLTDYGAMTFTATTTNPTKGTTAVDKIRCRRRSEHLQCFFEYRQTGAGTAGSGDYLITIPNSLQIDTNKVTPYATLEGTGVYVTNNAVGYINAAVASVQGAGHVSVYDATRVRFFINDSANAGAANSSFYALSNATLMYLGYFEVPIQGWAENQRAPTLIGSVTSNSTNAFLIESAFFTNSGTPALSRQTGTMQVGALTDNGVGDTTIPITGFSSTPYCFCTPYTTGGQCMIDSSTAISSTTVRVQTNNASGTGADMDFFLMCMGPR